MAQVKNLPYEQLQSDTIKLVRLPLIIGVVMVHASLEGIVIGGEQFINILDFPVYDYYKFFIDKVLGVRIPLYFFISGYLFFNRADSFGFADYKKKIRRRTDTLLIPYLSWTIITILILLLQQQVFSEFSSGAQKSILDWNFYDVYNAFWGDPISVSLWFVRDLFSIMLLSPALYWLIKRFKMLPVILFTLAWIIFEKRTLCGFAFFGMGAYFSITKRNFVRTFAPYSWKIYGIFALLACGLFFLKGTLFEPYFNRLMTPVGSICVVLICSHLLYKNVCKPSDTLANASFFIYMYHCLVINPLLKVVVKLVPMESSFILIFMHILCTTVIVFVGLGMYLLIRKYSPLLLKLLSGGR